MDVFTLIQRSSHGSFFFEITRDDRVVEIAAGRVGTDGEVQARAFASAAEARAFVEEQLTLRRGRGYAEVEQESILSVGEARDPELEAALLADPDGLASYLVYSDWLQARGDPRGELIAVQARLAQGGDARAERQEQELLSDFGEYFWGELWPFRDDVTLQWHLGFIRSAELLADPEEQALAPMVQGVLACGSARLLRELSLAYRYENGGGRGYSEAVDAIAAGGERPTIRCLTIGRASRYDQDDLKIGPLGRLGQTLPNLEELSLFGSYPELDGLPLPQLRSLRLVCSLESSGLLVDRSWPKLETLELELLESDLALDALLTPRRLPALKRLAVHGELLDDAALQTICGSGLLERLVSLDLSFGELGGGAAEALLAHRDQLARLERLDVSSNRISAIDREALAALGPFVKTELTEEEELERDEYYYDEIEPISSGYDVLDIDGHDHIRVQDDSYDEYDGDDCGYDEDEYRLTEYRDDPGELDDADGDFRSLAMQQAENWKDSE